MKPSIGRIVHFVEDGAVYAAIVTQVWSDTCVNLHVMYPAHKGTIVEVTSVVADESGKETRSWHWPPKV